MDVASKQRPAAITRRTELILPSGMTLADWRRLGRQMFIISDSSTWWLGDWLVYGQEHYPHRYKRAIAETALDYQTLRNYAWVARKFAPPRRREKLSFQHHAEVAGLPEGEQDKWLLLAEENGWTRNVLRKSIRESREPRKPVEAPLIEMSLEPERSEKWQSAAQTAGLELLEWIVRTLDLAVAELATAADPVGTSSE
ncbi:LmbU family transcriptional regulator [Streptomyces sp. B6B3]|uniref:LmbU family transcriptional regulator n=1 Tax=Streptomyces sp. B6B3 TaxID=3153570 RepID=UPI00325E5622